MCIITFHFQNHPKYKLVVAANRDEFYERPTKEAAFWEDHTNILAGRDLKEMGTWLGITKEGRFAALTNYRDLVSEQSNRISRGEIVKSFLTSDQHASSFLEELRHAKDDYNGFNVIVGTPDELYYYGNKQEDITQINSGTHSVSNHLLNTPWPKVKSARKMLQQYVQTNDDIQINHLFEQLNSHKIADDEFLPNTGIGIELERQLSPIFIKTDNYGTRSSTIILVTHQNEVTFMERTYNSGSLKKENKFEFRIKG